MPRIRWQAQAVEFKIDVLQLAPLLIREAGVDPCILDHMPPQAVKKEVRNVVSGPGTEPRSLELASNAGHSALCPLITAEGILRCSDSHYTFSCFLRNRVGFDKHFHRLCTGASRAPLVVSNRNRFHAYSSGRQAGLLSDCAGHAPGPPPFRAKLEMLIITCSEGSVAKNKSIFLVFPCSISVSPET
jgi:hypothetical protein